MTGESGIGELVGEVLVGRKFEFQRSDDFLRRTPQLRRILTPTDLNKEKLKKIRKNIGSKVHSSSSIGQLSVNNDHKALKILCFTSK